MTVRKVAKRRSVVPAVTPDAQPTATVPTSAVTVARVPSGVASSYIHRDVNGVHDFDLFDAALNNMMNILLVGPTGPGKTTAFMAYAESRDMPFYAIPSNVAVEPSQLFGKPWNRDGKWVWIDGGVTDIFRNGGLLLINEANFLPDRIGTVLFSGLDGRREVTLMDHEAETVRAHRPPDGRTGAKRCWCDLPFEQCRKKWVLIAADMNEGASYGGTRPLNAAFRNRFVIQVDWDYSKPVEAQLIASPALLDLAGKLREKVAAGEYDTPVSTNMLMEFERITGIFGIGYATTNFIAHFPPSEAASVMAVFRTVHENLEREVPLMTRTHSTTTPTVPEGPEDPFAWLDWR